MQEITNGRKLFVHSFNHMKKFHVLVAIHENVPSDLTTDEIKKRFGLTSRHTAYIKEPSGERVYVVRHQEWRGR